MNSRQLARLNRRVNPELLDKIDGKDPFMGGHSIKKTSGATSNRKRVLRTAAVGNLALSANLFTVLGKHRGPPVLIHAPPAADLG